MRKFVLLVAASMAVASPAVANEARVEARGGVIWLGSTSEATYGGAVGYDVDLGKSAFVGVEVSGDKIDLSGSKVAFGFTGRIGGKSESGFRLFGAAGYTTEACTGCKGQVHLGMGAEQNIASNIYAKVEYRHFYGTSTALAGDAASLGLGMRF